MSAAKRYIVFLLLLFAAGLAVVMLFPRGDAERTSVLRVGAGDDITGVLLDEIAAISGGSVETYRFMDCCSNSSQWALISDEVDMGFFCNHMSLYTVNADDDFEIYGPVVMNAEVIACKGEPDDITRLGLPQKRSHIKELAEQRLPGVETAEINVESTLYAVESGQVDGVVVDVSREEDMEGYGFYPLSDQDYISFCLVVRRDIIGTAAFEEFISCCNAAAEKLSRGEYAVGAVKFLYLQG